MEKETTGIFEKTIELLDEILSAIDVTDELKEKVKELQIEFERRISPCESCGVLVESDENYCYGCHKIICINCSETYGHFPDEEHGMKPKED